MQSAKLCKVQNCATLSKVHNYARCKNMQVKTNPMFCNNLSAEGAKSDVFLGRICTTLRTA